MLRLVLFVVCSFLSEMQSKYALSSTCQVRLTTVNGTICCPGTRWTRFRSPKKPIYPLASPIPTSRIWRVPVRGGYPTGGTHSSINTVVQCCQIPYNTQGVTLLITPTHRHGQTNFMHSILHIIELLSISILIADWESGAVLSVAMYSVE